MLVVGIGYTVYYVHCFETDNALTQ